jgi:hypothetical protein
VTAACRLCGGSLPAGRDRVYCSQACRQRAYRRRHQPGATAPPDLPAARSRTTTGVYEGGECGHRLAGERRCPDCNRYARRIGTGGACHGCGEILTVDELLEAAID